MIAYQSRDRRITLYHDDNRMVLPTLDAVDHIISDPPYSPVTHNGALTAKKKPTVDGVRPIGDVSTLIDFASTDAATISETLAMVECRRWCVMTVDWSFMRDFELTPPVGYRFVRFGIWRKPNGAPQFTGDRPGVGWEAVAILHNAVGRMRWNGGGHHGVWVHNVRNNEGYHPTEKPQSLLREWLIQFTEPDDLILDPWAGSASVGVACIATGRRYVGIEIDERFVATAIRRLEEPPLLMLEA